ncbi:HAD family hydrolase [Geminicoccus flavidas]|uniref:HAD family hydrolase n=1 Tax=Geminicoccus flavidas TaxID=2506407 RepID=UPI00190F41B7|nr:HAD family hydrolase [Geminicoccus flavidas]
MTRTTVEGDRGLPAIDLLISDVDGTLLRTDKSLTEVTRQAVDRLRRAGVRFSIISARPTRGLRLPLDGLQVTEPAAAFNGGTIVATDGAILRAYRLADATARTALERLRRPGIELWLFSDDRWLVEKADGPLVAREERAVGFGPELVENLADHVVRVDKIVAASDDHALLAALEQEEGRALAGQAQALRSQPYYLDVTAPEADKGSGVVALAEAIGVPLERVAVIGDGHNDLPMFAKAGLAIAMGQASDEVKAAARFVTAGNDADGVAQAIDRLLLGRP